MDTRQLTAALTKIYHDEGQRIVFWNDADREFEEVVTTLQLDNVTVLKVPEAGALAIKIRLEQDDPVGKYLLYSPSKEPEYEDDWLLDMRLYSRSFRADRASILLDELGLGEQQSLRQHLDERRKFFDSKERLQKLKPLVSPTDTDLDLDCKMMAVVAKAEQPELFTLLLTIYHAYADQEEIELENEPTIWEQLSKFDLTDSFWQMVKRSFGYEDEYPSLKKFLIRLFVTDFAHHLKATLPTAWLNLVLPAAGRQNAFLFLGQWRDSSSRSSSYGKLSEVVAGLIHLNDHLHRYEFHELVEVMSFEAIEREVASGLRKFVQSTATTIKVDEVREIAARRQTGYWVTQKGTGDVSPQQYAAIYNALIFAAEFYALRNQYQQDFHYADAPTMYRAYETELYRFDQYYRRFCEEADKMEIGDILKPLRKELEACYTNWYLPTLAISWGLFVAPLLQSWQLDKVPLQHQFFAKQVKPRLEEADNRKAFVIISDAFRYEAAQELTDELNGKYRFEAALSSQLGVLPSYTALGMASLLPHEELAYTTKGEVLVDGTANATLEQRNEILARYGGMACKSDVLTAMKKEEGREFVAGKRVVYVYHNVVDAMGDSSSTEDHTFDGVRKAIQELAELTKYIINNLNGNYVIITADHGFLFTETSPGEPEKSRLVERPEGTIKAKKRYLIGQDLPAEDAIWHGQTSVTAEAVGDMEFWIPKGANRFHFVGGARFIHGGAMLQEIVVPVITVRHIKGKGAKETRTRSVAVQVLGSNYKITTSRHRFELLQMEQVTDRIKPITLKIAVYEGDDLVTNEASITFDSSSIVMDERKKSVTLTLRERTYDKRAAYRLILRDADTGIEQTSVPVVIDRAFSDDF